MLPSGRALALLSRICSPNVKLRQIMPFKEDLISLRATIFYFTDALKVNRGLPAAIPHLKRIVFYVIML